MSAHRGPASDMLINKLTATIYIPHEVCNSPESILWLHRAASSVKSEIRKKETDQHVVQRYNLLRHPHQVPSGVLVNEHLEKLVLVVNV